MNKEQAYDEKINPLMSKIIDICNEHGIAMLCTFAIPTEEDEGLRCTTHLPDGDGEFDERCRSACVAVRSGMHQAMMLTTENVDGSKVMTAVLG